MPGLRAVAPVESKPDPEIDPAGFFQHIKTIGQPALAALIGNAFHLKREPGAATFIFDKSQANMIPMMRSPRNLDALRAAVADYFQAPCDIRFAVGADPRVAQRRKRDQEVLEDVKSNPKVRFLLDRFEASILKWEELDDPDQKDGKE